MAALLFYSSDGFAQWKFSAMAGPGLATFGGDDRKDWGGIDSNPKFALRVHAGLITDLIVSEKILVSAGMLYSVKGAQYNGKEYSSLNQKNIDVSYSKILSYIDVPLTIQYKLNDRFSILGGPQVSFLVDAVLKSSKSAQKAFGYDSKENVKDDYNTFDLAFISGLSCKLNYSISIIATYQHGFFEIGHDRVYDAISSKYVDQDFSIMNRVIALSVKYTFINK